MSGQELLVIAVGGLAGYWLVSFFIRSRKPVAQPRQESPAGEQSDQQRSESQGSPESNASDWYQVLGVTQHASGDEIRFAYKRLLAQYHPDKVASLGPELRDLANRKSQEITHAYRTAMLHRGETA